MKYGPLMAHTPSGLTPLTADRLPMHSGAQEPGASFFLFPSLSQYLMILGEKYFETLRKYLYGISCHDYFVSVTKKSLKKEVVYFSLSFL